MFIGLYYHQLEAKGRVSLPKAFRTQAKDWIITRGFDGGLFVFPQTTFEQQFQSSTFTSKDNRDLVRLMTNNSFSLKPDRHGRVLLPDYLTKYAQLKKQLVIAGSNTWIEIWDRDRYHTYIESLESIEKIAERVHDNT